MPRSKRDDGGNEDCFADSFPAHQYGYPNELQVVDLSAAPSDNVAKFAHRIKVMWAACDLHQLAVSITRDIFIYNLGSGHELTNSSREHPHLQHYG